MNDDGTPAIELVVEGITEQGQLFRPRDWIDRLMETLLSFGADRRQHSKPYAGPERRCRQIEFLRAALCDGNQCLIVDLRLRDANPAAYAFLMDFVKSNSLRCRERRGD